MDSDNNRCDYCEANAEMWLELGSYGLGEPIGICVNKACIDKAASDMRDYADSIDCWVSARKEENQ